MQERGRGDVSRAATVAVVMLVCFTALAFGFGIKDLCTRHQWDGYQYRTSCYNDIYALFFFRGVNMHDETTVVGGRTVTERVQHFPYVDGDGKLNDAQPDGDLEYPVGTGYYIGAIARAASDNGQEFFRLNALGLALCALLTALLLLLLAERPWRVLYFAGAPSLVLYAFHNWDLLAVVMMVAGVYAFARGADGWAGVWLGAGTATKLFPGFLLIAFVYARWRNREGKPRRMIASAVGVFALFNLPVMLINFRGWMTPWTFQSTRFPNFETHWYMLYRHLGALASQDFWFGPFAKLSSVAGGLLFLLGAALLVRADARGGRVRPYAMSFGLLVVFLLTNKVFSPQYVLWILPFFALLEIPWYAFAAFAVTEAAVWFAISGYFIADLAVQHAQQGGIPSVVASATAHAAHVLTIVEVFTYLRYAVLVWLLWLSMRVPERVVAEPLSAELTAGPVESPV